MSLFDGMAGDLSCFFVNTATIQARTTVRDDTTGKTSQSYADKVTNIKVAFWKSGESQKYKGGRIDPDVVGKVIINPKDLAGATLDKSDKITIDGEAFLFVDPNDVMGYGEMIECKLKRINTDGQ